MFFSFRFSDPCLLNPSDNDSKVSGQNTPDCRNGNIGGSACDLAQQNQFFAALMEQIKILHDTNSRICQNLHETKGTGHKVFPKNLCTPSFLLSDYRASEFLLKIFVLPAIIIDFLSITTRSSFYVFVAPVNTNTQSILKP